MEKAANSYPMLSIIIPIYNAEAYLRQCIESVLSQDFTDYELWLIDDGSKDSSIDIINEYASTDSRIKTAFIKGHGPSIPRNYGLQRASGKYILFIDSDDYLPPMALTMLVGKARRFPDADFIRGNQRILVNDEREAKSIFASKRSQYSDNLIDGESFMVDVLDKDFAPIDSLIKREYLQKNGILFHEELCILEDGPFIIEICSNNPKCLYINEETYVYRLGNPSSVTNSSKNYKKCLSLIDGAKYSKILMMNFQHNGRQHILKRSVEHCISAIFQACTNLNHKEAKLIYNQLRSLWPKLPMYGHSAKHRAFIRMYNACPILSFYMLSAMRFLIKK